MADVPDPLGGDVQAFAERVKLSGGKDDNNAEQWVKEASEGKPGSLEGKWQSRWSGGKDLSWEPLRAELVVEVAYDHLQSGRFRHTAQFRRWRSDKSPEDCTYAQLEVVAPQELAEIFGT